MISRPVSYSRVGIAWENWSGSPVEFVTERVMPILPESKDIGRGQFGDKLYERVLKYQSTQCRINPAQQKK